MKVKSHQMSSILHKHTFILRQEHNLKNKTKQSNQINQFKFCLFLKVVFLLKNLICQALDNINIVYCILY